MKYVLHHNASITGAVLARLNRNAEVYQEVIESPGESIKGPEYFINGQVTEFYRNVEYILSFPTLLL